MHKKNPELMTFGGHLEVLRRMFLRVLGVVVALAIVIFCLKDVAFELLLAPTDNGFCLYSWIENVSSLFGVDFKFEEFSVQLVSTELASQFMIHLTSSLYLALLLASPYMLFELFGFVAPALYEREKRYAIIVVVLVYILFMIGVLLSYFIIFPISFRFLATYQVADTVVNTITLSSYISTFTSLTLMMALVFQMPIISYVLARIGVVSSRALRKYRKHAVLVIAIVSAVITPPDIMTCVLVMGPLCLLYECSVCVVAFVERKISKLDA